MKTTLALVAALLVAGCVSAPVAPAEPEVKMYPGGMTTIVLGGVEHMVLNPEQADKLITLIRNLKAKADTLEQGCS